MNMTFKDIFNSVDKGGKAVVYELVVNKGEITGSQYMSDYTIRQIVVYSAKMETEENRFLSLFNWDSEITTVYLYDERNNIIACGLPESTRCGHVFLTREEALAELRRLMEEEAARWQKSTLDATY
jgi:hypothetical protein